MCSFRTISFVAAIILTSDVFNAIRIYEGTNMGQPVNATWHQRVEPIRRVDDTTRTSKPVLSEEPKGTPDLYKVKLTQRGYLQFLRYLTDVPPLRGYTFCLWFAGSNLSHPQPLFSYSVQEKVRLLSFWFEPRDRTLRMSIREDLAYKVRADIREGKWHHICQSWNGIFGEWAVFLDGVKIGSGQVNKYKETYVPGGGDIVVGQEPTDFHKGLDDGIEGEVFGFNMVDEATRGDVKLPPAKVPEFAETQYIPPFKSLPPTKKSYSEIKAFITSLPNKPADYRERNRAPGGPKGPLASTATRKFKPKNPRKHPPKYQPRPQRSKQRMSYKPMLRKAIVYEREDRQLNDNQLVKKVGQLQEEPLQVQKHSMHTYRAPKEEQKAFQYEIYEVTDEDGEGETKTIRKARNNFDINAARQGNTEYARARKHQKQPLTKFHFEKNVEAIGRSIRAEPTRSEFQKATLNFIPVYEVVDDIRKKRSVDQDGEHAVNFQPLPPIPKTFTGLFSENRSKDIIGKNLNQFFPNQTVDPMRAVLFPIVEGVQPKTGKSRDMQYANRRNMVISLRELERWRGQSSGKELIEKGFVECTVDRGSPVTDKDRLIVSWSDTPVRIYGGAIVSSAEPKCGHF